MHSYVTNRLNLLLVVLLVFSSSFATAALTEGVVQRSEGSLYYFSDSLNGRNIAAVPGNSVIEAQMRRLSAGDFVSFEATSVKNIDVLTISAINYISLGLLLGVWLGDEGSCFHFSSFTEVAIYDSINSSHCANPKQTPKSKKQVLDFFIAPEPQGWYMLMSTYYANFAAELIIKNRKTIQMNLFDDETGKVFSIITLRRQ
jgi:hypothetical protein